MRPAKIGGLLGLILTVAAGAGSVIEHNISQQYFSQGKPVVAKQTKGYSNVLGYVALGGVMALLTLGTHYLARDTPYQERRRAEVDSQVGRCSESFPF